MLTKLLMLILKCERSCPITLCLTPADWRCGGCVIVAMPCIFFILSIFALQTLSTHTIHKHNRTFIYHKYAHYFTIQSAGTRPGSAPADHLSATIGVVQCADSRSSARLSHWGNRSRYWIIG